MLKPYKFVVQAIVQHVEGDEVLGEQSSEPVTLFGSDALAKWAEGFDAKLAQLEEEM